MKNNITFIVSVIGLCFSQQGEAKQKPNVILVFADDFGYGDLACYGHEVHQTPAFDLMAKEGVKLTDFYVGSSVSTPSRSALLTGCYPKRISMHVNADPKPIMGRGRQVLFPVSTKGLNPEEVTIAEMLKTSGYSTACIGKWHLGDQLAFLPTKQGFDYFYGIPYSHDMGKEYCPLPLMEQEKVIEAPLSADSLTYKFTVKAIDYIKEQKKKPFFLYLAHGMTHKPLDASPKFKGKSGNGLYGDAVEELDWSMAQLFSVLKEQNIDKNTIVIFASDNGAAKGAGGSNGILRDWKGSTYEGGFRVPCLVRWPEGIVGGNTCKEITTTMDILPTIASWCKTKLPSNRIIDGKDISALITNNKSLKEDRVFYYYQRNQLQAIRWGKWKYHLPLEQSIVGPASDKLQPRGAQLYNLEMDTKESNNLVANYPQVVDKMHELIGSARKDMGDWKYEGENIRPAGYIDEPFGRYFESGKKVINSCN